MCPALRCERESPLLIRRLCNFLPAAFSSSQKKAGQLSVRPTQFRRVLHQWPPGWATPGPVGPRLRAWARLMRRLDRGELIRARGGREGATGRIVQSQRVHVPTELREGEARLQVLGSARQTGMGRISNRGRDVSRGRSSAASFKTSRGLRGLRRATARSAALPSSPRRGGFLSVVLPSTGLTRARGAVVAFWGSSALLACLLKGSSMS